MISDVIDINAGPGIDQLNAFADAAARADEKFAGLKKSAAGLSFSGAGPDNFAAAWSSAIGKVKADLADLAASGGKLDSLGAGAAGAAGKLKAAGDAGKGAADGLKAAGDGGKAASAGLDSAGTSASGAAAKLKAAGDSAKGAGDGLKGVGDAGKTAGEGLDLGAASAARFADMMRSAASASADASLAIARSQKVQADAGAALTTTSVEQDAALARSAKQRGAAVKQAAADAEATNKRYGNLLLGGAGVLGYGIYKAAQLQAGATRLATTAGESPQNLDMIQQGIIKMAAQTATSQSQLMSGAYMIESAGFHGKDALGVLKAAAQGAYAEGAPLGETGNALTSLLNAYGLKKGVPVQSQAMSAMNQIIAMVSQGKMTMAGAVTALPNVLPIAAKSGLSFGQVGGALATMTSMGMSPDQASQNLAHTIGALSGPSRVQTTEMQQLGVNSVQLSKNLGKEGLTGAISTVETAILHHMGPAGTVLLKSFNASKLAAASARQEIAAMPQSLRGTAQAFLDGSITTKQWTNDLKTLPPLQSNLLKQFGSTADAAHGFNNNLKAGGGNAQTFVDALSKVMGGQVGRNVALMLGGAGMPGFQSRVGVVTAAGQHPGQDVAGWDQVQKTLKFQLGSFEQGLQGAATQIGKAALPIATDITKAMSGAAGFFAGHKKLTVDLSLIGGALGAVAIGQKIASPIKAALQGVGTIAKALHIPGLDKLANLGKAGGIETAMVSGGRAAGAEIEAAMVAGGRAAAAEIRAGESIPGGVPGVIPGGKGKPGVTAGGTALAAGEDTAVTAGVGAVLGPAVAAAVAAMLSRQVLSGVSSGPGGKNWWENPFGMAGPHDRGSANNWVSSFSPYERNAPNIASAVTGGLSYFLGFRPGLPAPPKPQPVSLGNVSLIPPGGLHGRALPPVPAATGTPGAAYAANTLRAGSQIRIPAPDTSALQQAKSKVQQDLNAISQALAMGKAHPGKIPAPDMSALQQAKGKVQADLNAINQALGKTTGKAVKIAPPDMSALNAAAGKAAQAATQITAALKTGLSKPVHAAPPDLHAYGQAAGTARGDGVAISSGLAQGILAGEGAAVAAAHQVAAAVEAALNVSLQVHSPSRVTYRIGQHTGTGLANGIKSKVHEVKAAAKQLSEAAAASLRTGLLGGQSAIDAALTALGKGPRPQDVQAIDQATAKLVSQVPKGHSALVTWMHNENTTLDRLAARRSVLMAEITDAQQITTSAISSASIVTAGSGSYTPALAASNGPIAASQTIQGLQYMAGDQSDFAGQIAQLKKAGLNATSLDQLTQAGAQQGLPVAMGLLQGGPGAIKQANQLEKSIIGSAGKLGNTGGPAMYQAGVDAGNAAARGLKSQLGTVESVMSQIAGKMVGALKSVLGHSTTASKKAATSAAAGTAASAASSGTGAGTSALHIPSLGKLAQMASTDAAALARDASAGNASAAALTRLASAANRAYAGGHSGGGHHGGGGGGGTTVNVTVNVTVQGTLVHQSDLADHLQGVLLARNAQNWQAGIVLPGRHT